MIGRASRARRLLPIVLTAVALAYLAGALISGSATFPRLVLGAFTPDPTRQLGRQYDHQIKPLLARHCYSCHGDEKAEAGIALDAFASLASIQTQRKTWQRVSTMLHQRLMPPKKRRSRPTQDEYDQIATWIERALAHTESTSPPNPGRVTMHRLNRREYNNTIRDLLLVDFQPADDFPADDAGYGFDNIADVLSMSTLLAEKYLDSADEIMRRAIVTARPVERTVHRYLAGKMKATVGQVRDGGAHNLWSNGTLSAERQFVAAGRYTILVRAWAEQAGGELARMAIHVGDRKPEAFQVQAEPADYQVQVELEPGTHRMAVAFLNDYYKPDDPDPSQRDRNLIVEHVEVDGPHDPPPLVLPESHRRIFFVSPGSEWPQEHCARQIIDRFASRAFRRPATERQIASVLSLYHRARQEGDRFEQAVQLALTSVLLSPHFLYRIELDRPEQADDDGVHPVSDWELASRLSYFLWSSMPDAELFALAEAGRLSDPKILVLQALRMLRDPKGQALVENFTGQWLELRKLDEWRPDAATFASYTDSLGQAMRREAELYFSTIVRENRSILEFLDSDWTFANVPLARHYGLADLHADDDGRFHRVSLAGAGRGGVITMAAVLALTSNPTRTSPVKRGKWILEKILGQPPPPPPPGVAELEDSSSEEATGTLRQRMEQHRSDPNCASCHSRMDPLGFALEPYDAIGAFRTNDGQEAIDASGTLPDGTAIDGPAGLKAVLLERKGEFVRCFVENLLTYALGRGLEPYDHGAVGAICRKVAASDYAFASVIVSIVTSDPFCKRSIKRAPP